MEISLSVDDIIERLKKEYNTDDIQFDDHEFSGWGEAPEFIIKNPKEHKVEGGSE